MGPLKRVFALLPFEVRGGCREGQLFTLQFLLLLVPVLALLLLNQMRWLRRL